MTERPIPILVVGATGMLGSKIARALLARPAEAKVCVMIRPGTAEDTRTLTVVRELAELGADMVTADLADPVSLLAATRGMEVVVSALQGGVEIIVQGQLALLEAARRNRVRRFIPSDFAADLFEVEDGMHPLLNMRKEADRAIAASGLEHVHVLNGVFMEFLFAPQLGVFDPDRGAATYWGDGKMKLDMTTTDDTASYTAAAALDRSLKSGKFAIRGDSLDVFEASRLYETARGVHFRMTSQGSIGELEQRIVDARDSDSDPMAIVPDAYQHAMFSGRAALRDVQNDRYPNIRPLSLGQFLAASG